MQRHVSKSLLGCVHMHPDDMEVNVHSIET